MLAPRQDLSARYRTLLITAFFKAVAGVTAAVSLAADSLASQFRRFQETAVLTANHPVLFAALEGASQVEAQALLTRVADKTGSFDVAVLDPAGRVVSAARGTRHGPDLPSFQRALDGVLSCPGAEIR